MKKYLILFAIITFQISKVNSQFFYNYQEYIKLAECVYNKSPLDSIRLFDLKNKYKTYSNYYTYCLNYLNHALSSYFNDSVLNYENYIKLIPLDSITDPNEKEIVKEKNKVIEQKLYYYNTNELGLGTLCNYYLYRDTIKIYSNVLLNFQRKVLFRKSTCRDARLNAVSVLPFMELPESFLDSVKLYCNMPDLVKAALGDTICENMFINQFLAQIDDTINYSFPDKTLTFNLFYINSPKCWEAFAKGLSAKRSTWIKLYFNSFEEFRLPVSSIFYNFWKEKPFASVLLEQYNEYFKDELSVFLEYELKKNDKLDSIAYYNYIKSQRNHVSKCIASYLEKKYNIDITVNNYYTGYTLYYESPLEVMDTLEFKLNIIYNGNYTKQDYIEFKEDFLKKWEKHDLFFLYEAWGNAYELFGRMEHKQYEF